jgi:hypothetical protein
MPALGHRFATILVTICSLGLAQRMVTLRNESGRRMFRARASAVVQRVTGLRDGCASQSAAQSNVRFALKADKRHTSRFVRFVPKADTSHAEASAFLYSSFVCQAVGVRSVGWGRSFFIGDAKMMALSQCARRGGICTISYCVPGY